MVSEKKKKQVAELKPKLKEYTVIGVINMFKLPARQLHDIRNKLRGKAVIKMVKKRLIIKALKESGLPGIEELVPSVKGEPALLLSNENPFKLAMMISESKSSAPAKPGDISPREIMIPAGPTSLMAGPVIGELQKIKLPASVEGGKIAIKADTVVAKEGDEITADIAGVLSKLGIEPMEIGLNLVAAWESGHIYNQEILFTPPEKYLDDLKAAHSRAFSLSYSIRYFTPDNMPMFLSKAHNEATALATAANILTSETVKPLLAKADAQAKAVKALVKEPAPAEAPKEKEVPEEKKEEAPKEDAKPEEKPKEEPEPEEAKPEAEAPPEEKKEEEKK
jgi:large subunit ribosomal protein L10